MNYSWTDLQKDDQRSRACNCIGPQNGQPVCPCMMRNVTVKDGRYVQIIDHGPVSKSPHETELLTGHCG